MPLASQYLLLVLYNVEAFFIVELFIEDTQYLSLYCARYILLSNEYTLNPNSMIEIVPEL